MNLIKRFLDRPRWRKIKNFKKGEREIWIKFAVRDGIEGWLTSKFKNGKDCFFIPNPSWSQPGFADTEWGRRLQNLTTLTCLDAEVPG